MPATPVDRVTLCDVGPRDGLQNEATILAPGVRAELCARLAAAGLPVVEAASFVHPARVPQMAGAEEVFAALGAHARTTFAALVLNEKGAARALAAGAARLHLAYPLTDAFARANQNTTLEEAARAAERMLADVRLRALTPTVTLGVAFGCPFAGRVDPGVVVDHAERMARAGAAEVMLADTIGVGVPRQVRALVAGAQGVAGEVPVGLHLHNTRNTGYANAVAGLEAGVRRLDASIGGLGGCPFAPRATGNVATEDLLYLLEGEGMATGVDLDALVRVAEWLEATLARPLPGLVHRAGPFVAAG